MMRKRKKLQVSKIKQSKLTESPALWSSGLSRTVCDKNTQESYSPQLNDLQGHKVIPVKYKRLHSSIVFRCPKESNLTNVNGGQWLTIHRDRRKQPSIDLLTQSVVLALILLSLSTIVTSTGLPHLSGDDDHNQIRLEILSNINKRETSSLPIEHRQVRQTQDQDQENTMNSNQSTTASSPSKEHQEIVVNEDNGEHTGEVRLILTVVYLAIFVIGVIGNVCNCLVIADGRNRYMKTATNYYLFSLSVSDLILLTFGLPHDIVNLWHPSPYLFNEFVCISRGWISEASTYASVLVIVAFTVERYLAICHPLKAHTMSRLSRSIKVIIVIWLVASTCALVVVMQFGIQTIIVNDDSLSDSNSTTAAGEMIDKSNNDVGRQQPPSTASDQQSSQPPRTRAIAQCTTVALNETIFELSVIIFFIIPMAVITILYIRLGHHLRQKTYIIRQNRLAREKNLQISSSEITSNHTLTTQQYTTPAASTTTTTRLDQNHHNSLFKSKSLNHQANNLLRTANCNETGGSSVSSASSGTGSCISNNETPHSTGQADKEAKLAANKLLISGQSSSANCCVTERQQTTAKGAPNFYGLTLTCCLPNCSNGLSSAPNLTGPVNLMELKTTSESTCTQVTIGRSPRRSRRRCAVPMTSRQQIQSLSSDQHEKDRRNNNGTHTDRKCLYQQINGDSHVERFELSPHRDKACWETNDGSSTRSAPPGSRLTTTHLTAESCQNDRTIKDALKLSCVVNSGPEKRSCFVSSSSNIDIDPPGGSNGDIHLSLESCRQTECNSRGAKGDPQRDHSPVGVGRAWSSSDDISENNFKCLEGAEGANFEGIKYDSWTKMTPSKNRVSPGEKTTPHSGRRKAIELGRGVRRGTSQSDANLKSPKLDVINELEVGENDSGGLVSIRGATSENLAQSVVASQRWQVCRAHPNDQSKPANNLLRPNDNRAPKIVQITDVQMIKGRGAPTDPGEATEIEPTNDDDDDDDDIQRASNEVSGKSVVDAAGTTIVVSSSSQEAIETSMKNESHGRDAPKTTRASSFTPNSRVRANFNQNLGSPGDPQPRGSRSSIGQAVNSKQTFALNSTVNTASMQSVIKMLVSVVVMFFICWAPFHAQRLMAIYVREPTSEQIYVFNLLNHISGISYYISAVANPILYSLYSMRFRQAFRDTFSSLCPVSRS